jgi:hypothetical protein
MIEAPTIMRAKDSRRMDSAHTPLPINAQVPPIKNPRLRPILPCVVRIKKREREREWSSENRKCERKVHSCETDQMCRGRLSWVEQTMRCEAGIHNNTWDAKTIATGSVANCFIPMTSSLLEKQKQEKPMTNSVVSKIK